MSPDDPVSAVALNVKSAIEDTRKQAREQLAAAWQLHITRVEDELRSRWGAHLESLLNERFTDLEATLRKQIEESFEERLKAEVEAARVDERRTAIRSVGEHLNLTARRLRTAERQEEWSSALVDAALGFATRATVFSLQGRNLRLEKCSQATGAWEAPVTEAPAIQQAVDTLEPLVAAYTPSQISPSLAAALGQVAPRLYVFPVVARGKAVAVLTAEGDPSEIDGNSLELLATLASAVYEARAAENDAKQPAGLIRIGATGQASGQTAELTPAAPATPAASYEMSHDETDLHLRAQRFARVHVAEIRLYKSKAVKDGRAAGTLYRVLKEDVDRGREAFRQQFMQAPGMPDYFHMELVKTLANDDPDLLGTDYPGALS